MSRAEFDESAGAPRDAAAAGDPAQAPTQVDSAHEPMHRLRPDEPVGLPLARARVFGALFGEHSPAAAFGRFRVLDRLGAGGMGVVYEAYDPDLARGVALKLVGVAAKDRDTALAEAKALARLSHPNVVPIYDVGIERDHVYLVMELVRGKTLRDWPAGRTVREILDVYGQAGLALAAAHRAGLVHRDFKPDNAIVGADHRVRVVDFGLACEADDPAHGIELPRRIAGTPRYMAPEIRAGAAITPAADQYSFCIALGETLPLAREPAPRRLAAILARGSAADPAARWASMAELLHALARDPVRTRRRAAAGLGLAAAIAGAAFWIGQLRASTPASCDGGAARLDAAWPAPARTAALARLATLGDYGRSLAPQLARALDDHARRWIAHDRAACLDRRRATESSALSDRRTACLARGTDALTEVGALIGRAAPGELAQLPRAVQSIPDPTDCSNRAALVSEVAPPPPGLAAPIAEVERRLTAARIQIGAGRHDAALAEAGPAVAAARALGYEPLLARALVVQGHAQMNLIDRPAAVPILGEALAHAIAAHDDALEIEAWARRAWAGIDDPAAALAGLDVVEPLANRPGSADFARALLYNNAGSVELARDHRDRARALFDRAIREAQAVTGPGALELVAARINAALTTDDPARADALLADAAADLAARLGPDHPDTLEAQRLRGVSTVTDLRRAEQLLAPVCAGLERHAITNVEYCWSEVGQLRWDLGDRDGARDAMARAARSPGEPPDSAACAALLGGDPRGAARQLADALAATPAPVDGRWWERAARGRLALGLGRARRALGDLRGARDALERAVEDLGAAAHAGTSAWFHRRFGRARIELAFTLAALGEAPEQRAALAAGAAAWLRSVGGLASEIDALARIR
jgi:predicted Ser/Thr protein kinase